MYVNIKHGSSQLLYIWIYNSYGIRMPKLKENDESPSLFCIDGVNIKFPALYPTPKLLDLYLFDSSELRYPAVFVVFETKKY